MAGGSSKGGAFGLGALVGLVVSAAIAVALSVLSPLGGGDTARQAASGQNETPSATSSNASSTSGGATNTVSEPATQPAPEPEPAEQVAIAAPEPETQPATAPAPTPEPEAAPEPEEETAAPAAVAVNSGLPPFKANAEIYNGDRSQPLLSIVLISDPSDRGLLDEMLLLPGPLSVVVPPNAGDTESVLLDIRDAGFEALLGFETATEGSDVLNSVSDTVIGVAMMGEGAGTNDAANAVVPMLQAGGFAMLDASADGGSAPLRAAQSSGVPAAPGGRNFDEIQSSAMVFQALERAAFDARRTGAFVVIGRAHPAVLTGLRRWMNVKANKTVNVAPLSVVIEKVGRQ